MEAETSSVGLPRRVEVLRSRPGQVVTLLYIGVAISYLWWRATATLNPDALVLSIVFLGADIMGFGFFLLFAANLWERHRSFAPPPESGLSVDVFIPTYNEPPSILRPTVAAALAMDYPHRTYVLDDKRRDEIRLLCEELGAEYLTRPDNRGAKAGNINAALGKTDGDLIAVFDADHVPFKNFLTELLGYFRDPRVALVQAPQVYYNLDSFQHAQASSGKDALWHEQSIFYDRIMPGKDRWNAAFWCGSSAIVRRAALTEIGGVDTRTVTEDMHTTMSIHANGWRTIYHDRTLAVGIAPDDVESFLGQRLRWAQGAAQILRSDNPLLRRGLTLRQRIAYFTSVVYILEYVPKAVYLLTPAIALALDELPMRNMGWNLLWRFVPYYLLGMLATRLLVGNTNPYFRSERFHVLKLWIMLRALWTLIWPGKLTFKVTAKAGDGRDHRVASLRLLRWQIFAGLACVVTAAWAIAAPSLEGIDRDLTGMSLAITLGWAAINTAMIASVVRWTWRRPHRRAVYRFALAVPIAFGNGPHSETGRTVDISSAGMSWYSRRRRSVGETVIVRALLGPGAEIEAEARIVTATTMPTVEGYRYAAAFTAMSAASERTLLLFLFQTLAPETLVAAPATTNAPARRTPGVPPTERLAS